MTVSTEIYNASRSTVSNREMEYGSDVRSIMANLVSFKHNLA
jgi:hypothetical protein